MSIGLGIVLVVVGAIFAFAVEAPIPGLDGHAFGWVLILAGVLVAILSAVVAQGGRRRRTVAVTEHADGTVSETERRTEVRRTGGL